MNQKPEKFHPDLQTSHCELMNGIRETEDRGDNPQYLGRVDQITTAQSAGRVHAPEIKIDKGYRLLDSDNNQGVRWLIFGAVVASMSLTWFTISALPLSGTPTSGGGGPSVSIDSSARILDSKKEDRLQMPAPAPKSQNFYPYSAINHAKPFSRAAAGGLQTRVKVTPTPETRPTTIEGWTLREVTNGTAVLEGPDGIRRVTRGDTIPGVGRVESIFRWGNRLLVATSTGLISTP
jgi:hypothetical protein